MHSPDIPKVKILSLIGPFALVGITAFGGGVLPHLSLRLLNKRWLSEGTLAEALNWAQCSPGCNGTNISSYLGWKLSGLRAALLLPVVLILPGLFVMLFASSYISFIPEQTIQKILESVVAVVVALSLVMIWKLTQPIRTDWLQLGIIGLTFVLVGILRVPISLVLIPTIIITWYLDVGTPSSH